MKVFARISTTLMLSCAAFQAAADAASEWMPFTANGVTVMLGVQAPYSAVNDTARIPANTSTQLDVFANDATPLNFTVDIAQPENGTVSFNATTLRLQYTPNPGFFGLESFQYELVDGNGQKSNVGNVDLEVVIGTAATPTLTPGVPSGGAGLRYHVDTESQLIVMESSPGAQIFYNIFDTETGVNSGDIEYTQPFNIYKTVPQGQEQLIRITAQAKGPGYDESARIIYTYYFPPPFGGVASLNQLGWSHERVKVGQPVTISWDTEKVASCVELTSSRTWGEDPVETLRSPKGSATYKFDAPQIVDSKWYCRNTFNQNTLPGTGSVITRSVIVDKLDAPQNTSAVRGHAVTTASLSWEPVPYAHHYKVQKREKGFWATFRDNVKSHNIAVALGQGNHSFRVIGCSVRSCNDGVWSPEFSLSLGGEESLFAVNDTAVVGANTSDNSIAVRNNDNIDPRYYTTVIIKRQPLDGVVTVGTDGMPKYTPNAGFSGLDSFDYQLRAHEINFTSNVATVTIQVAQDLADIEIISPNDGDSFAEGQSVPVQVQLNTVANILGGKNRKASAFAGKSQSPGAQNAGGAPSIQVKLASENTWQTANVVDGIYQTKYDNLPVGSYRLQARTIDTSSGNPIGSPREKVFKVSSQPIVDFVAPVESFNFGRDGHGDVFVRVKKALPQSSGGSVQQSDPSCSVECAGEYVTLNNAQVEVRYAVVLAEDAQANMALTHVTSDYDSTTGRFKIPLSGFLPGEYRVQVRAKYRLGDLESNPQNRNFFFGKPPKALTLDWVKNPVTVGEPAQLTWHFQGATSCNSADLQGTAAEGTESFTYYELGQKNFQISCVNSENESYDYVIPALTVERLPAPANLRQDN